MLKLNHKGFTLVEIMIVVAIIALLAAIAIPNIVRARLNANEGAAMSAVRTIATSAESFRAVQTPPAYPADMTALATAVPSYIPSGFTEGGTVQGYLYHIGGGSGTNEYVAMCYPANRGNTGNRSFGITEDGVLRAVGTSIAAEQSHNTVTGWTAVSGM